MILGHTMSDADGFLLAVDEPVADMLGRTRREIVGMSYLDLTHADDRAPNKLRVMSLIPGAGVTTIRKRYLRPDGGIVAIDCQASRLDTGPDRGRLVGTLLTIDHHAAPPTPQQLWAAARQQLLLDDARKAAFGSDLSIDDAWTIMLQLYLIEAEGGAVDSRELAMIRDIRRPVLDRWVKALVRRDLIEDLDAPGESLQLTAAGVRQIERTLAGIARQA